MRKLLLAATAVMLLLAGSCVVSPSLVFMESQTEGLPNLIFNPGFNPYSLDPATALKGWMVDHDPPDIKESNVVIDTNVALDGKTSLRIDASKHATIIISDSFDVMRYGGYFIKANVRTDSKDNPDIVLRFISFKENGKVYNRIKSKIRPTEDWTQGTISAGFIKPGVSFGRVAIMVSPFKDGSVWIDDVGCWKVHHFRID
ncbi:MAG TPA: hypothetical protein GX398_07495 [Candidatus Cloacimonetes bacterium]|nr:hypothetical protein [Candidatus Cloacimonadota bacterium]